MAKERRTFEVVNLPPSMRYKFVIKYKHPLN